jgi:hypothetical protein
MCRYGEPSVDGAYKHWVRQCMHMLPPVTSWRPTNPGVHCRTMSSCPTGMLHKQPSIPLVRACDPGTTGFSSHPDPGALMHNSVSWLTQGSTMRDHQLAPYVMPCDCPWAHCSNAIQSTCLVQHLCAAEHTMCCLLLQGSSSRRQIVYIHPSTPGVARTPRAMQPSSSSMLRSSWTLE